MAKKKIQFRGTKIEIKTDGEVFGLRAGDRVECRGCDRESFPSGCGEAIIIEGFDLSEARLFYFRRVKNEEPEQGTGSCYIENLENSKILKRTNYKPGDKVRIVKDPKDPDAGPYWVPDLNQYKGKIVTLDAQVVRGAWKIKEDVNREWHFDELWFEPVVEENKQPLTPAELFKQGKLREGDWLVAMEDWFLPASKVESLPEVNFTE